MERDTFDSSERMSNNVKVLLDCFDVQTQREIIEFCKRVSAIEVDVYILMARKAACFFNCLERLGLIHFNGYVTSERVLDMKRDWLQGKRVLIIDDAIVSGTTIYKTIRALKECNVQSIRVQVLTVNSRWFQEDLLIDCDGTRYLQKDCNSATNEKCIDLCYRIVKAILLQPRPYDIDFPFFLGVDLKNDEFEKTLNIPNWDCFDISSLEQRNNNVSSITLLPSKREINEFARQVNCTLNENVLVKIRTYITHRNKNREYHTVRIVPMIVFDKVDKVYIAELFQSIIHSNDNLIDANEFETFPSMLRMVQFYLSYRLAKYWISRLPEQVKGRWQSISLEDRNLSFIFPSEIVDRVHKICDSDRTRLVKVALPVEETVNDNIVAKEFNTATDYVSVETRLIAPFIDMYYKKEIPCREKVKELGKHVFVEENTELTERLNEGLTVGDLCNLISDTKDCYDIRTKVSLFIDRSVDMGIIVPIIQESKDCVFRAFRHGEDVLFGEKEEKLYLRLLHKFQEKSGQSMDAEQNGITHISAEKMIVIFTQLGIKQKLLTQYLFNYTVNPNDDNAKACKVLRIKPYLKGNIAVVGSVVEHQRNRKIPYITDERKAMWLTSVFIDSEKIQITDGKRYNIDSPDVSAFQRSAIHTVDSIGALFGQLYNKNVNTGINLDDDSLTLLATCSSKEDCTKAIAAEIYVFTQSYVSPKHLIIRNKRLDYHVLNQLKQSVAYEALNSAYMKMMGYDTGEVNEIIRRVSFENETEQGLWETWFEETAELTDNGNEDYKQTVNETYNNCKCLSMYMLMAYALLQDVYFLKFKKDTGFRGYSYHNKCQEVISKCVNVLEKMKSRTLLPKNRLCYEDLVSFRDRVRETYSGTDRDLQVEKDIPQDLLDVGQNNISYLIECSELILERVRLTLGEYGKMSNNQERYSNVMAVIYKCVNDNDYHAFYNIMTACFSKVASHYEEEGVKLAYLPKKHHPDIYLGDDEDVYWIVGKGNDAPTALAAIAMNLSYTTRANSFRMIYFGDVSYIYSIKKQEGADGAFCCNTFHTFIEETKASVFEPSSNERRRITTVVDSRRANEDKFINYITSKANKSKGDDKNKYSLVKKYESNLAGSDSSVSVFESQYQYIKKPEDKHVDVGIITILDEEASAVREVFDLKDLPIGYRGRLYSIGSTQGQKGTMSVVMTQSINMGGESVINAYNDMKADYHPDIVFLTGIAGGLGKDVDYTSVVLGRQIIAYNMVKDSEEGRKERGNAYQIGSTIVPYYQAVRRRNESHPLVPAKGSKKGTIHIIEGDIASGSAVIASKLSDIRQWIYNYNDKVLACETEAYGLSSAFYEQELSSIKPKYGVCVVRGISDLADTDKEKKKKYRIPAAKNAAIVVKAMIEFI